jgi:hypothetical protein
MIAAEMAMVQQSAAISMVKQTAEAEKGIVAILENAAEQVPVSSSRGRHVNITV